LPSRPPPSRAAAAEAAARPSIGARGHGADHVRRTPRDARGAWAPAVGKRTGAVLVIHENRGLTDHIRNIAGRFAASGYSALALDLLSEEGGTAAFPGEARSAPP